MISHSSEEYCSHAEALLRRAGTIIAATWGAGTNAEINGQDWFQMAGRWISDYERRDEWIPPSQRQEKPNG